jgi:putative two-component system response regulator
MTGDAVDLCRARRVLVVDDSEPFAAALAELLRMRGFVADAVGDGASAMRQLEQHPPDVVLLDVELPGEDGFEVCRRLKDNEATRLTPVVLLTGLRGPEHRLAGIEAGADDFLTKPFDTSELVARVRSLSRLKRYTDELESAESVIMSLALIVEARDAYTEGHCDRLAAHAVGVGRTMGLPEEDLAALPARRPDARRRQDRDPGCRPAEAVAIDTSGVRHRQAAHAHRRAPVWRDAIAGTGADDHPSAP